MTDSPPPPTASGTAATIPDRLLGVGDIISGSVRTLMRAPMVFIVLPLMAAAIIAIPAIFISAMIVAGTAGDSSGVTGAAFLLGLVMLPLVVYAVMRIAAAVSIGAYRVALGESADLRSLWNAASGVVWRLVALAFLLIGAVMVVSLAVLFLLIGLFSIDDNSGGIAMVLIFFASLPLYLFLLVKLAFLVQVICIEKAGPAEAVRRSFALVRGFWWPTFGRMLMLSLLGIPVSMISSMVMTPAQLAADDTAVSVMALVVGVVTYSVLSFLYQVFTLIYLTIMYIDARRREETPAYLSHGYPMPGVPYSSPAGTTGYQGYAPPPVAPGWGQSGWNPSQPGHSAGPGWGQDPYGQQSWGPNQQGGQPWGQGQQGAGPGQGASPYGGSGQGSPAAPGPPPPPPVRPFAQQSQPGSGQGDVDDRAGDPYPGNYRPDPEQEPRSQG